jgi:ribosomal protein L11 methyltransferase
MSASRSWKVTALAPRNVVTAALIAHEEAAGWDPEIVLGGSEVAEDRPDDWQLEAWLGREPSDADLRAIAALLAPAVAELAVEQLPETDWVTLSQQGLAPIAEGRFHVRTPDYPPLDEADVRKFVIPASRAFGTGHHATTAGCLAMLSAMRARGLGVRNFADVGTGTGLLAFAALALWPRSVATASDIDPVCARVVLDNADANGVRLGPGTGALTLVIAPGLDHPLLAARAPFDLIIANILAGPLIELMPDFAAALVPGGHLVLAGLLSRQERGVRRAALRHGLRLAARRRRGDWSILWLKRQRGG